MEGNVKPLFKQPALLRPLTGDMAHLIDRVADEVGELQQAIISRRRASVLDELVDVQYFLAQIAQKHGITQSMLTEYSMIKGWLRDAGVKDKPRELRVAAAVLDGRNSMALLQPQEQ